MLSPNTPSTVETGGACLCREIRPLLKQNLNTLHLLLEMIALEETDCVVSKEGYGCANGNGCVNDDEGGFGHRPLSANFQKWPCQQSKGQ